MAASARSLAAASLHVGLVLALGARIPGLRLAALGCHFVRRFRLSQCHSQGGVRGLARHVVLRVRHFLAGIRHLVGGFVAHRRHILGASRLRLRDVGLRLGCRLSGAAGDGQEQGDGAIAVMLLIMFIAFDLDD